MAFFQYLHNIIKLGVSFRRICVKGMWCVLLIDIAFGRLLRGIL